jgi:GT2 family glycosyltransferase
VSPPVVSVVVAVYNGSQVLPKALEALQRNTERCYELILVENGSTDESASLVRQAEDATVVLNTRNLGFGVANNQGAARARGRYLLFMNQDVFVDRGWLSPLLERIEADRRIGAVGPKLIFPDGSLQCAGALLSRSGSANCYGTGDRPEKAEYGRTRVVDYLSGACLLVRRCAFEDVGGFDASYGLAYFEDADLCLSLASRGYRSVYEPRSRVTHMLGQPGESILALALRNRALFERRWRRVLASRPLSPLAASRRRTLNALEAAALAAADHDEFGMRSSGNILGLTSRATSNR